MSDLKLLFKLCYTDSFLIDGDAPLDMHTRMRLAFLANALEFKECVDEALSFFMKSSVEEALAGLEVLPEELQNHHFMAALMKRMISDLEKDFFNKERVVRCMGKIIDRIANEATKDRAEEDRKGDMVHEAGHALGKALGPVRNLFDPSDPEGGQDHFYDDEDHFYMHLSLKPHVKALSMDAVAAFLEKSKLNVQVENEAYFLLCAWIYQCPHQEAGEGKKGGGSEDDDDDDDDPMVAAFEKLAVHIRFQHLTTDFLANVVANCPLATSSDLLPWIMRCSLQTRNTLPIMARASNISLGRFDRAVGVSEWSVWTCFGLEDLLPVKEGGHVAKYICVAAGYPIALKISRGGLKDTLGIHFYVAGLNHEGAEEKGCPKQHAFLKVRIQKFPPCQQVSCMYQPFTGKWQGWVDFFEKPWKEIVHRESPFFCEKGRLAFKVFIGETKHDDAY